MAAYLFGSLSREEAEAKVTEAGLDTDGTFLVRTRDGKPGEFVMCVVFKNKPTHHLITPNAEGLLTVNKRSFAGAKKITELVNALRKKQPGWPVALVKPIKNPAAKKTSGKSASPKKAAGSIKKKKSGTLEKKKSKSKSLKKKKPIWLHGDISKEDADEVITKAGLDDGRYLVRSRAGKKTEFVLGVVYKGKPTHHLITKVDGNYLINKKSYGDHPKVSSLVATLQKKGTPKWPVPLDKPVPSAKYLADQAASSSAAAEEDAAPAAEAPAAAAAEEESAPAAAEEETPPPAAAAAPAEVEVVTLGVSQDTTRVLTRATINIGTKINQYEPALARKMNELVLLERFVIDIKNANQNRMTFAQLNTAMLDGGHHANTTA